MTKEWQLESEQGSINAREENIWVKLQIKKEQQKSLRQV